MCLTLRPKTPITVYKIYEQTSDKAQDASYGFPFFRYSLIPLSLKSGEAISSNRRDAAITEHESKKNEIFLGLHCFMNLDDAKLLIPTAIVGAIIVEATIAPEDFVSFGVFNLFGVKGNLPSVVAMKIKIVRTVYAQNVPIKLDVAAKPAGPRRDARGRFIKKILLTY